MCCSCKGYVENKEEGVIDNILLMIKMVGVEIEEDYL